MEVLSGGQGGRRAGGGADTGDGRGGEPVGAQGDQGEAGAQQQQVGAALFDVAQHAAGQVGGAAGGPVDGVGEGQDPGLVGGGERPRAGEAGGGRRRR